MIELVSPQTLLHSYINIYKKKFTICTILYRTNSFECYGKIDLKTTVELNTKQTVSYFRKMFLNSIPGTQTAAIVDVLNTLLTSAKCTSLGRAITVLKMIATFFPRFLDLHVHLTYQKLITFPFSCN